MSQKSKNLITGCVSNLATWISSGFLSLVVMAACMIPALWTLQLDVADLTANSIDISQLCELAICLSVVIGVSTFLSTYILLGHPTAYVGSLFAICSTGVFANRTVFILAVAPIIIGSIIGYYLNRYTAYKVKQTDNSSTFDFVCMRFMCAWLAVLLTLALLNGQFHWSAYIIWILQLGLHLALSFRGIWQRAEMQVATYQYNAHEVRLACGLEMDDHLSGHGDRDRR